jgi:hypothetical protein
MEGDLTGGALDFADHHEVRSKRLGAFLHVSGWIEVGEDYRHRDVSADNTPHIS